jgi:GNAT superfamily N-acetyltransferase
MTHTIRPFSSDDYPAIVDIGNAVYREYPGSVEEQRFQDKHRDSKCVLQRWVAEGAGAVVAYGEYTQFPGTYHPRKFVISVVVHPDHQGRGIGSALYDHVIKSLESFDPISLRSNCRADMARSIRFLEDRGFIEIMRSWESRLDVSAFDLSPYAGLDEKMRAHGIEIKTFRELEAYPERNRKLYELENELSEDVPHPEPRTPITYEFFLQRTLENPNLLPDAYFVALHQRAYVGMSNLWSSQGNNDIYTGLTGVRREYRRRGIALALKLRGIAYAKAHGNPIIKTWNESNNRPMLSINEALGYVKQPAWIDFRKLLREETL